MLTPVFIFLLIIFILFLTTLFVIFVFDGELQLFYKYDKNINKLTYILKISKIILKKHEINFNKPGAEKRKKKKSKMAFKYVWRALEIDNVSSELNIKIVEGTGDAAQTAIYYGALYFVAEIIKIILENKTDLYNDKIEIICDFNKKVFSVDISCIFKLKLVNIISEVLKIYRLNKNNDKVGDINV